jgi:hypothetical protein
MEGEHTDPTTVDEATFERLLAECIERSRRARDETQGPESRSLALVVTNLEQAALWHCNGRAMLHLGDNALIDWLLEQI